MVSEEHRRNGIGRQLMQEFEIFAKKQGARLVALATRRAKDFYKSLGFELSAEYYRKLL